MGRGIFVTGTDTDAGKTVATCALLAALTAQGQVARGFKPLETDCLPDGQGGWLPGRDARRLAAACGGSIADASWACLPEPLAPSESARRAGIPLDLGAALAAIDERVSRPGWTLVEGAGGLFVPLDDRRTWIDVLERTRLPTLIVAGNKLGVLNHALLTLDALRRRDLEILGIVLGEPSADPPSVARQTNLAVLRRWAAPAPVIPLGHVPSEAHEDLAAAGDPLVRALGLLDIPPEPPG